MIADQTRRRRFDLLAVGLLLIAMGAALMISADIGVAPYDVLLTGLARRTGLDIGVIASTLPLAFIVLGVALGGRAGPGSFAVMLIGPVLTTMLHVLPHIEPLPLRIAQFSLGFGLVAIGVTAMVVAETGPGPVEIVMLAIHDRGFELARTRTAIESASVAVGWVLGGQAGAGTVAFTLAIGPALRWLLRRSGYRADDIDDAVFRAEPGV